MSQRSRPVRTVSSKPVSTRPGSPKTKTVMKRPARWVFWSPPPHANAMASWALLPLRAFLGFTFCFAGLQKLTNPNFFNAQSPSSIQAQLIAANRISPLHVLLGHLLQFATPLGIVIALGELAVGIGALLGLWTRIAALGGMALSAMLFLTVSFHSSPYYTGVDIVFFFAWTPLLIAGAGVLSLDSLISSFARNEVGQGSPVFVPVTFELVQKVCGNFDDGHCAAQKGAPCDTKGCPYLAAQHTPSVRANPDAVDRRMLVLGGAAVATAGIVGLTTAGISAAIGRMVGGAKSPNSGSGTLPGPSASGSTSTTAPTGATTTAPAGVTTTTTPVAVPAGTRVGPAKDVPVGGSASFQLPSSGDPGLMLQLSSGSFLAYDAICPHAGCTVGYSSAAKLIVCPCHGSEFNPSNGDVIQGPAPRGLTSYPVAEGPDGELYVKD